MRYHRVRYTKPRAARATRRIEIDNGDNGNGNGTGTRFRNSVAGRAAKREALGEQRRKQQSLCANCNQFMELADTKFRDKVFVDSIPNPVVHRKCPV